MKVLPGNCHLLGPHPSYLPRLSEALSGPQGRHELAMYGHRLEQLDVHLDLYEDEGPIRAMGIDPRGIAELHYTQATYHLLDGLGGPISVRARPLKVIGQDHHGIARRFCLDHGLDASLVINEQKVQEYREQLKEASLSLPDLLSDLGAAFFRDPYKKFSPHVIMAIMFKRFELDEKLEFLDDCLEEFPFPLDIDLGDIVIKLIPALRVHDVTRQMIYPATPYPSRVRYGLDTDTRVIEFQAIGERVVSLNIEPDYADSDQKIDSANVAFHDVTHGYKLAKHGFPHSFFGLCVLVQDVLKNNGRVHSWCAEEFLGDYEGDVEDFVNSYLEDPADGEIDRRLQVETLQQLFSTIHPDDVDEALISQVREMLQQDFDQDEISTILGQE